MFKCSNIQMFKCSNINKVKLLLECNSGVPPSIFVIVFVVVVLVVIVFVVVVFVVVIFVVIVFVVIVFVVVVFVVNQMYEGSEVSKVTLCVKILKWHPPTQ